MDERSLIGILERVGDDVQGMSSRQRYNIGFFYFCRSKRRLVDEIDRINRIIVAQSRRVLVPLLDGSLVPFYSNIFVACMRANNVSRKW